MWLVATRGQQRNKNRVKAHNARFILVFKDVLFDEGRAKQNKTTGRKVLGIMKNGG